MASTLVPSSTEIVLRFPHSTTTTTTTARGENGTQGMINGDYQRTLSMDDESDIGDGGENCENVKEEGTTDDSPVAAGHVLVDEEEEEDGDDDVFDSSPRVIETNKKNASMTGVNSNGQYDDLSFSSSVQQHGEDESHHQRAPSSSTTSPRLLFNDDESKKLPMQVVVAVVNGKNAMPAVESSIPHNSMEATTSTSIVLPSTNNTLRRQHHQQSSVFDGSSMIIPAEPSSSSACSSPNGISLFEKLVRTHPIWYLPHIGRVAAAHLLRGKSPGVFIVRRSSQPNSMAISIKLPRGVSQDIEHYLLETTIAGVHLEGSPNYFRELPFLLAYYCENGDELHTTLTLPKAVLDCETLRDLCSLALLGPEFWTSKHCIVESSSSAVMIGDDTIAQMADTGPKLPPPSPPTRLKEESIGTISKEKLTHSESNPEDITTRRNGDVRTTQQHQQSALHRRSLSMNGYPAAITNGGSMLDAENRAFTTAMLEHVGGTFRKPAPFPNPIRESDDERCVAPAKTTTAAINAKKNPTQKDRSVLGKFRSESVSSALSVVEGGGSSSKVREEKPQEERRSFRLRNLFDVARRPSLGSLSSQQQQQQSPAQQSSRFGLSSTSSSKNKKMKGSMDSVKHEQPLIPPKPTSISLQQQQQQSVFYIHGRTAPAPPSSLPPVPHIPQRNTSKRRSPSSSQIPQRTTTNPKDDHEYYYFTPAAIPSPTFSGSLNESRSISSLLQEAAAAEERQAAETPTMARRKLLTFKPGSPGGNDDDITPTTSSADTTLERHVNKKTTAGNIVQVSPDHAEQRNTPPLFGPMARQQSAPPIEVQRPSNNSPPSQASPTATASFIRPPVLRREKSDLGWLPSSGDNKMAAMYAQQQQRRAILPPENKDEKSKTCVEELRRSRLESLLRQQQMVSNANVLHSRRDGSAHVISPGLAKKPIMPTVVSSSSCPRGASATNGGGNHGPFSTSSAPSSATNSVLRTKSTRQQGSTPASTNPHRLSAPNLPELCPNSPTNGAGMTERRAVTEMLRDVRSRQQQKPVNVTVTALHTINEGLVTPMARRRFGAKRNAEQTTERRLSQSLEDLPTATTTSQEPNPKGPIVPPSRKSSSQEKTEKLSGKSQPSQLPVRRHDSSSSTASNSANQRRNEKAFHDETNFQWVAVTNEMRSRQKVAKVTPTRSPYSSHGSNSGSAALGSRFSDYVMLNDCAEIMSPDLGGAHDEEDPEYGRYGSIVGGDNRRHDSQISSTPSSASFLSPGYAQQQQQFHQDDDTRSVVSAAGTVFNEPWDSSVWENLLTIATSMDNTNPTPTDGRSSFANSSAASSNRPSRIESIGDPRLSSATSTKEETERSKKHPLQPMKPPPNRQTSAAWAERLKKLKENNIPPPLAPKWEEFSSCVPMSSESSLPTSTPTNSLESRRKSFMTAAAAEALWAQQNDEGGSGGRGGNLAEEVSPFNEDRFNLAPVASPLRFRNGTSASNRKADRTKKRPVNDPGYKIQDCVEKLANDITTFFGAQVQYFIKCTTEGHETDPLMVLRNVRQFMNGLKNYLVKHGECELHPLIEQERSKLRPTEFLNIDAILEGVLQKIILAPLKPHLYHLLVKDGSSNGSLEVLSENLAIIRNRPPSELGISIESCDSTTMEQVRTSLRKMQHHYSPLKKLEYLLHAVSVAYENRHGMTPGTSNGRSVSSANQLPCADELLRWFVFLVSRCSMVGCEIESVYMWNLLHPALLAGEASYYLTAFSSAVHVLKNVDLLPKLNDVCSLSSQVGDGGEGFIKVAVPDEISGAICYHSFPIMPQLTVTRLCRMIARKCGITNPEDYGLYLLVDGYETCLIPSECPELVKEHLRTSNKAHLFAYKRHEAKIAWPKVAVSPRL